MKLQAVLTILIISICAISTSNQKSLPDSPTYVAAVIEYNKIINLADPAQETSDNLNEYNRIISSTEVRSADIIIFPESTLNSIETAEFVPEPEDRIAPCDNQSYYLEAMVTLCTYARLRQKYIVVNINEKSICPDKQQVMYEDPRKCGVNNTNIYNTNVVFDRNGTVISKYRKFNLFGEKGVLKPWKYEVVTFDTDFNVTFGMFICFDLMFDHPPLDLVRKGVTDIIFTAHWFSELPFLTAVQIQQSWAYKNNVNLLAAGANNPSIGSTGSGIYHGRYGPLTAVMNHLSRSQILLATVPKMSASGVTPERIPIVKGNPSEMLNLYLKRDQLDKYVTEEIIIPNYVTEKASYILEATVCHKTFCCDFDANITLLPIPLEGLFEGVPYHYRLVAYSGWRTFDGFVDGAVKVCGILACTDKTLASCGRRFSNDTIVQNTFKFDWIKVETILEPKTDAHIMPNSLDFSLIPLNPSEFNYSEYMEFEYDVHSEKTVVLELIQPKDDLLTFALYARDYEPKSSAHRSTATLIAAGLAIYSAIYVYFMK